MPTVDWGPVAAWAGAAATVLVVITTSLVALGYFDRFRAARIQLSYEDREPWRRPGLLPDGTPVLWVRLGVENLGKSTAAGCVGRLIAAETAGVAREDLDPVQLRWAGLPRSRAFEPIDLRPHQREYLNVVCLPRDGGWRLVTFEDPDFDPGFTTELGRPRSHRLSVSVFADNAPAGHTTLILDTGPGGEPRLDLG